MRSLLLLITMIFFTLHLKSQTINNVTTDGNKIYLNGNVYYIKGVCYNPIKKGESRSNILDTSKINADIELMKDACINTVRLYVPLDNIDVLDKFAAAGIKVIVGFQNYDDTYLYADINHGTYLDFVEKYYAHPAILMWELGNEYNYHPEWFDNNINNWYTILNNAAEEIHLIDSYHPVSTAHGEVPTTSVLSACPNIDVWGMNVYRWDDPSGALTTFSDRSSLPFYLSEVGADSYNFSGSTENQASHAIATNSILKKVIANSKVSGACVFEFCDEWWKNASGNNSLHDVASNPNSIPFDNNADEEWFGIVDIDRNTKTAYDTVKSCFCNINTSVDQLNTASGISLYPNPAIDFVKIKIPSAQKLNKVQIFNTQGKLLKTLNNSKVSGEIIWNLNNNVGSKVNAGIYIISVSGNNFKTHLKVLVRN
jgi:hypothetical protein